MIMIKGGKKLWETEKSENDNETGYQFLENDKKIPGRACAKGLQENEINLEK